MWLWYKKYEIEKVPIIQTTILATTIIKVLTTIPTTNLQTTINKVPTTFPNILSTTIKKINPTIKIYTTILISDQHKASTTLIQTDKLTTINNAYEDIDSFYLSYKNNDISKDTFKDSILDKLRYELKVGKLNILIDNIIKKDKKI